MWEKGIKVKDEVIQFTAGNDRIVDLQFAPFDLIGSMAHVIMLKHIKILNDNEEVDLIKGLIEIYEDVLNEKFSIEEGIEDVHSQIEKILTEKLGETGKKIHTARSRNDQVITCLKLFFREKLCIIHSKVQLIAKLLIQKSEETKDILIPGYTHTQVAMTSSFGLWFSAYAESFIEDLIFVNAAFRYANLSPLGSAAGYGSGFPVDRDMTAELLEFDGLHVNSINAQLSRGKTERYILMALTGISHTMAKMADDIVLFMCQNFDFLSLNANLTTGSSIMPHKKNPDVPELIRARCNAIQGKMTEVMFITTGLNSGYHRDYQQLKQIVTEAMHDVIYCLDMLEIIIPGLKLNKGLMDRDIYKYLNSVDEINKKVQSGIPFREAYMLTALDIEKGVFIPGERTIQSHCGSIDNLSNNRIETKLGKITKEININECINFRERFIKEIKINHEIQK